MLPKAEGCCTGLQLSAKEVVLGRPDMASRSCSAPITSLFLPSPSASPRRLGGPCRSLARSAGGDGRDAPHETPGPPPSPPRGSPLPSRSLSRSSPGFFFLLLLLTPPVAHKTILPGSAGGSKSRLRPVRSTPGAAPAPGRDRGGFARPRCPHPGRQSHGAEAHGLAPPIPRWVSFFFSFFFFFLPPLSFPSPRLASPSPSPLREAAGNGTIFFFPGGRISGLPKPPTGGDAAPSQGDPAGAVGSAAGGVGVKRPGRPRSLAKASQCGAQAAAAAPARLLIAPAGAAGDGSGWTGCTAGGGRRRRGRP